MKGFFANDELKCKCCGKVAMDTEFMNKLNAARFMAGFPFVLSSGYRCEKHNKEVGSSSNNHTSGKAVDILCRDADFRYELLKCLVGVRMRGIGIGPSFIHCDVNRKTPVIWVY